MSKITDYRKKIGSETFLEHIAEGVVISDDETTKVLYINSAAKKILDLEEGDIYKTRLIELVHPDDKVAVKNSFKKLKKLKKMVTERRIRQKNGRYIIVERSARILPDGNVLSIIRDITAEKDFDKRKDMFISMASHEFRGPISTAGLYIEMIISELKKTNSPKIKVSKMLTGVVSQLKRLTTLVGDMLDLSKIQAGKLEFRMAPFDLNKLVKEMSIEVPHLHGRKIEISVSGKLSRKVFGDRDRISQVIFNLLNNAVKYSPRSNKIEIKLEEKQDFAWVSITDFGIGIDKENQRKVFDRFYQIRDNSNQIYPGMGIGLYICREVVRKHRGKIFVRSSPGKGSTFTFVLPWRPPNLK